MTSKSLCFKLMKEDLKRRVWVLALTILGLVFTILVPTAIKCSEFMEESATWNASTRRRMVANIVNLLGLNGMAVFVLLAAGVLWAVSGFHYLHNSKKVDFYHSIPVKRITLFLSAYLNGILVPAVIYLVMQIASSALAWNAGVGVNHIGTIPMQYYVLNMVYYSMLYTTAVVAMMMTGNVVIALLGDGVFWAYGPAVTALVRGYFEWFHTYYETPETTAVFYRFIRYSSPFANYMYELQIAAEDRPEWGALLGAAAVTAALAVLAYSLYKIRPSEAAKKAMAFQRTEMPVKVLLVIPIALAFGMLFYAIRGKVFWLIFGTVFGVLLIHCMMEIIYNFDFRKLFGHRIHLGACMAVSVLLSLAGYYDWYGYDSWLPNPSKVAEASVVMGYHDNWVTYGQPEREEVILEDGTEGYSYYWQYQSQEDYIFKNMKLKDIYSVTEMAKKGVEADKMRRKSQYDVTSDEWERWVFRFRMNNGKVVYRWYSIPMDDEAKELQESIHDSAEYKLGVYPILGQTASDTAKVYYQQYDKRQSVDLDYEQMTRLLNVYQKEFEGLTMETRRRELPLGTIQFMTAEHAQANAYDNNKRYYNLEDRCYYPVYPSFERTLELLEEAGVTLIQLNEDTVESVKIYYHRAEDYMDSYYGGYGEDYAAVEYAAVDYDSSWEASLEKTADGDFLGKQISYDEKEDLRTLVPALCFRDYYAMNDYYEMDLPDYMDVTAVLKETGKEETVRREEYRGDTTSNREKSFYLDRNKVPGEDWEKYHLEFRGE